MAYMNQKLVSFASFSTREAASNAIQQVNGIKFDPEIDFALKVEFARSNSKVKRLLITGDFDIDDGVQEKRRKVNPSIQGSQQYSQQQYSQQQYNPQVVPLQSQQPQAPLQQTTQQAYNNTSYSKAAYSNSYSNYGSYDPNYASAYGYDNYSTPISTIPMNLSALPSHSTPSGSSYSRLNPCTTLFVTGIDPSLNQNDLISIFSVSPGFQRFRMGKEGVNCFLDFIDLTSSAIALSKFHNTLIGGSRLRVDYAKKRMGDTASGRAIQDIHMMQQQSYMGGEY